MTCDTNHCPSLTSTLIVTSNVDAFVFLGALTPTFSPPCGYKGAAPGCAGAGGDTEL